MAFWITSMLPVSSEVKSLMNDVNCAPCSHCPLQKSRAANQIGLIGYSRPRSAVITKAN